MRDSISCDLQYIASFIVYRAIYSILCQLQYIVPFTVYRTIYSVSCDLQYIVRFTVYCTIYSISCDFRARFNLLHTNIPSVHFVFFAKYPSRVLCEHVTLIDSSSTMFWIYAYPKVCACLLLYVRSSTKRCACLVLCRPQVCKQMRLPCSM